MGRSCCQRLMLAGMAVLAYGLQSSLAVAIEVKSHKVDSQFPVQNLRQIGSGSGVIIGPRLVLTNRHVTSADNGDVYDGFKIRLAPTYEKPIEARAIWICDDYDLALLELKSDVECDELLILQDLPPIGTKVTAFGFPLGEQFGVGLTASGGQITRHPVRSSPKSKDADNDSIRKSMWHDALTAGGSSGGPLFSEQNVLVGLVFGGLTKEKGYGLAVPADTVASFLKSTKTNPRVTFTTAAELNNARAKYDPKTITVFVDILDGRGKKRLNKAANDSSAVARDVEKSIRESLPQLSDESLRKVESGDFKDAFPVASASRITAGATLHLQGKMVLIQITDDGILVKIDGVLCKILLSDTGARELRAKIGNEILSDVPIDNVYFVGEAQDYETVRGTRNSYFPIVSINAIVEGARFKDDIKSILEQRAADREKLAVEEYKSKLDKMRTVLSRTFTDSSGKFSIEATIIGFNSKKGTVKLIRTGESKVFEVEFVKLSEKDRFWITTMTPNISKFGPALEKELTSTKAGNETRTPAPEPNAKPEASQKRSKSK